MKVYTKREDVLNMNSKKSNFIERPKVTIRRKTISAPANSAKWRIALRVANTKLFEEIILRARMKESVNVAK